MKVLFVMLLSIFAVPALACVPNIAVNSEYVVLNPGVETLEIDVDPGDSATIAIRMPVFRANVNVQLLIEGDDILKPVEDSRIGIKKFKVTDTGKVVFVFQMTNIRDQSVNEIRQEVEARVSYARGC